MNIWMNEWTNEILSGSVLSNLSSIVGDAKIDISTDTNTSLIVIQSPCMYASVNIVHGVMPYGILLMLCAINWVATIVSQYRLNKNMHFHTRKATGSLVPEINTEMDVNIHMYIGQITSNNVQLTTSMTDAAPLSKLIVATAGQLQLLCLLMHFRACEE